MVECLLMFSDQIVGVVEMEHFTEVLRYSFASYVSLTAAMDETDPTDPQVFQNETLIFAVAQQVGRDKYIYHFQHRERPQKFTVKTSFMVIPLEEPTAKVNLNLLAAKCKLQPDISKLLKEYYEVAD